MEAMLQKEENYKYDLNGLWKFHYAKNYESTIKGFEKTEYNCKNWDDIRVPAHIQMEGIWRASVCKCTVPLGRLGRSQTRRNSNSF